MFKFKLNTERARKNEKPITTKCSTFQVPEFIKEDEQWMIKPVLLFICLKRISPADLTPSSIKFVRGVK